MSWSRMGLEVQIARPQKSSKLQQLKNEKPTPPRRATPRERVYYIRGTHASGPPSAPAPAPVLGYYSSATNHDEHLSAREKHARCSEYFRELDPTAEAEGVMSVRRVALQVSAAERVVQAAEGHVRASMRLASILGVELAAPWVGGSEGSVGLDWSHDDRRLAVTFDAEGGIEFYASSPDYEHDGRGTASQDVLPYVWWLLAGRRSPHL